MDIQKIIFTFTVLFFCAHSSAHNTAQPHEESVKSLYALLHASKKLHTKCYDIFINGQSQKLITAVTQAQNNLALAEEKAPEEAYQIFLELDLNIRIWAIHAAQKNSDKKNIYRRVAQKFKHYAAVAKTASSLEEFCRCYITCF